MWPKLRDNDAEGYGWILPKGKPQKNKQPKPVDLVAQQKTVLTRKNVPRKRMFSYSSLIFYIF